MKSSKLIMGGLAALGLTTGLAFAQAEMDPEAITERIKPVGELCLEGEDCGTQSQAAASTGGGDAAAGGEIDGAAIYANGCAACHESGAAGAPVRGNEAAWADRTGQGFATLVDHAINGIGAMPPKGGNASLSDAEVEAAVAHLVEPVMDVPAGDDAAAPTDDGAAQAQESASAESGSDLDGEALYSSAGCVACHGSGAAGAPKLGDADAWAPRLEQGAEALYTSALNGKGAMPAKGGSSASEAEVKAIVDYMIEQAQ